MRRFINFFSYQVWLEKVVVQGVKTRNGQCRVTSADGEVVVDGVYHRDKEVLVIRKPGVNMGQEWEIQC